MYGALLEPGDTVEHVIREARIAYVHVARGSVRLDGATVAEGDAAMVSGQEKLVLQGGEDGEVLLFDLPQEV